MNDGYECLAAYSIAREGSSPKIPLKELFSKLESSFVLNVAQRKGADAITSETSITRNQLMVPARSYSKKDADIYATTSKSKDSWLKDEKLVVEEAHSDYDNLIPVRAKPKLSSDRNDLGLVSSVSSANSTKKKMYSPDLGKVFSNLTSNYAPTYEDIDPSSINSHSFTSHPAPPKRIFKHKKPFGFSPSYYQLEVEKELSLLPSYLQNPTFEQADVQSLVPSPSTSLLMTYTNRKSLDGLLHKRLFPQKREMQQVYGFQYDENSQHKISDESQHRYLRSAVLACFCCPLIAMLAIIFTVRLNEAVYTKNLMAIRERSKMVKMFIISSIVMGALTYITLLTMCAVVFMNQVDDTLHI